MFRKKVLSHLLVVVVTLVFAVSLNFVGSQAKGWLSAGTPLSTGFNYQGQLKKNGSPVTSTCDFIFSLWDADSGGQQLGVEQYVNGVSVSNGMFSVQLNEYEEFGGEAFNGDARWLEISVQCVGDSGFTDLGRQALSATPFAHYAVLAENARLLDGWDSSAFQQKYDNVIVVAKSGGDFTSIQAALDSITTASDTNRFLVWVAPGVYQERVTMKPYVDIQGAGELTTKITYSGSASKETGTVIGANDAELRFLTVENSGGDAYAVAIFIDTASTRLTNLTASVINSPGDAFAIYNHNAMPLIKDVTASASVGGGTSIGILNDYSAPYLDHIIVQAYGTTGSSNVGIYNINSTPNIAYSSLNAYGGVLCMGVYNYYSSPVIRHSSVKASGCTSTYGVRNFALSSTYFVKVQQSNIQAETNTIYNDIGFVAYVGSSILEGGAVTGGGTVVCAGTVDENYTFYSNTCP